jgi:hypothetical protein
VSTQHAVGLADALNNLGSDLLNVGHPREAHVALQESVTLFRRLVEHEPAPTPPSSPRPSAISDTACGQPTSSRKPWPRCATRSPGSDCSPGTNPAATPVIWSAGSTIAA